MADPVIVVMSYILGGRASFQAAHLI